MHTSIRRSGTSTNLTPQYTVTSGSRVLMSYRGGGSAYRNNYTTLGVATPVSTVVRVQAQGSWSPDE